MIRIEITSEDELPPFTFRWPVNVERFDRGWECRVTIEGEEHRLRHGIGRRHVYGRERVHTVTWLDGQVQVEGVAADDYRESRSLISRLHRGDGKLARWFAELERGYEGLPVVLHRAEIDAAHSPYRLALKVVEDDLEAWAAHSWLRSRQKQGKASPTGRTGRPQPGRSGSPHPKPDRRAVVRALLARGTELADRLAASGPQFTDDPEANRLIASDPFAFLVGVISDMGIKAERAWAIPFELKRRLGYLDPARVVDNSEAVYSAVRERPSVHRFTTRIPDWIVEAARIVQDEYGGRAGCIWGDNPTAAELLARLQRFPGIGQKKAAMAVRILAAELNIPVRDLFASEVAVDVHLRRVFLRTGLAEHDDVQEMIEAAKGLHRKDPGALDLPSWDIGRRWCHPTDPDCPACPLAKACPRLVDRAGGVKGV